MTYRTIILTNAAPVRIIQEDWPVIAHGLHESFDGEYECPANVKLEINIRVRRHADGRTIIYGHYELTTQWVDGHDVCRRAGYLYTDALSPDQLIRAIRKVGDEISAVSAVVQECVSELPPLEI